MKNKGKKKPNVPIPQPNEKTRKTGRGTLGGERGSGGSGGREHCRRKSREGDAYEGGESFQQREGRPKWGFGTDISDAVEEARPAVLSRGAGEDGVPEGFGLQATAGAGGVGIGRPPGRVGGQITLSGSHLVNSPSNELA